MPGKDASHLAAKELDRLLGYLVIDGGRIER